MKIDYLSLTNHVYKKLAANMYFESKYRNKFYFRVVYPISYSLFTVRTLISLVEYTLYNDCICYCTYLFVHLGKIAYLHDKTNPSWVPTLNLGYDKRGTSKGAEGRFERLKQREDKKKSHDAAASLLMLQDSSMTGEQNGGKKIEFTY